MREVVPDAASMKALCTVLRSHRQGKSDMRAVLLGFALVLVALPASAQDRNENHRRCAGMEGVDAQIVGCTALIQSGHEDREIVAFSYYQRGNAYMDKGLWDRAIDDYTHGIALERDTNAAGHYYYNRGLAYLHKGLYDQAIADFSKAISLTPNFRRAYVSRGLAYEKKGRRDEAVADYRAALKLKPDAKDALDGLKRLGASP
jgi:tetratricopeptide (TPR) repeat protein